ncbi:hypothetical protein ACFO3J_18420 [Streptomyces polygonati]|uniref:Uncharacterized protein n=1 Tax=Streptomyces polygonati TaxID=1617087 RepID=A0ABV8HNA3_9ACTN
MVARRIVVKVGGVIGLDDSEQLAAELARETGLDWREEPVPQGRHLSGGLAEFLLAAAVSGAASKVGEYAYGKSVEAVRAVVARWSARRLDPLDVQVDLEGADDGAPPDPRPGAQAPAGDLPQPRGELPPDNADQH